MRPFITLILGILLYAPLVARPLFFERRSSDEYRALLNNQALIFRPGSFTAGSVTVRFANASRSSLLEGIGASSPATYLGAGVRRTFRQFPKLAVRHLYPGVEVIFSGNGEHLEYDLMVSPGADLHRLRILFEGARRVQLDAEGDLHVETTDGDLLQKLPRVFDSDGRRVSASYVLLANRQVGFRIGHHNPRLALTIDPELVFSKYFGGSDSDSASAIATDAQGNIYIAGTSNSVDFPTTNRSQPVLKAPLVAISSGAGNITPLPVSSEASMLAVGGAPDGSALYAVAPDAVYVSSDHGATWTQNSPLPLPGANVASQSPSVNNIAVDSVDPSRVFVATNSGLYFTSQGGSQNWYPYTDGLPAGGNGSVNAAAVLLSPVDRPLVYVIVNAPPGLYKSTNYGSTFAPLNTNYPGKPQTDGFQQYVMALSADGSDFFVIDPYGTLLKSADEGVTWQVLAQQLFGAQQMLIDPANESNIYVVDNSGIHSSSDGGATFTTLLAPPSIPGGVRQIALDSPSGTLYYGTSSTVNAISVNGGVVNPLPISTPDLHSLVSLGGQVYAGFDTPSIPYVIKWDPSGTNILYSTFFGGTVLDIVQAMAVDAQGNCTVAGYTYSPDYPVTTGLSSHVIQAGSANGFITRLSPDGTQLIYSSLLGGSGAAASPGQSSTFIRGLALDSSGAAYVTGQTAAADFPVSSNAFQSARPQTMCNRPQQAFLMGTDLGVNAFASKISPNGSQLLYSTLCTGSCGSVGLGIAVNSAGEAVVAGYTSSTDLPTTAGAYQSAFPGSADSKKPPNPVIAGFTARISAAGDQMIAGTYLGGSYLTEANAVALDVQGNTYLTGATAKLLPGATPGAYQTTTVDNCVIPIAIGPAPPYGGTNDVFVLKLDAGLSTAGYMTYLGGGCNDAGNGVALDSSGNAWINGTTVSPDFPLKSPFVGHGIATGFVSEISADGSQLLFSSATDGVALAIDPTGAVHLAGAGVSSTVAKRTQLFGGPGKAVEWNKIDPASAPAVVIDNIQPITNYPQTMVVPSSLGLGVVPGELIRITGHNLGPVNSATGQLDSTGRLPFTLGGTTVLFNNIPAALVTVGDTAITCFAPFEIAQATSVTVEANGQRSNSVRTGVAPSDPQILSVMNADGSPNSADHPAKVGDVVSFFLSGMGETTPLSVDGLTNTPPLPVPTTQVIVGRSNMRVQPDFVGAAPGQIAGIVQINLTLPPGNYSSSPVYVGLNNANAPVYVSQ